MFGDWAMIIVLAVWMKVLTGSSSAAGLVFFVFAIVSLAAPLGGLVVDRLPKRRLMIATHIAMAGVMCLLLLVHNRSDAWLIYAVIALYGLGGDIFAAARSAMMKAMVPDEQLGDANSAYQSIREGLRIIAPLAGAGLFAVAGGGAVALVNAGTFLVSAATLVALRFDEPAARTEGAPLPARALRRRHAHHAHARPPRADNRPRRRAARRRFQRDAHLRGQREQPAPAAVVHRRARRIPGHRLDRRRHHRARAAQAASATFASRASGFSSSRFGDGALLVPRLSVIAPAAAVAGVGVVWAVVSLATAYQRRSPDAVQGRVAAAANMLFSVPQTISIAVGAALVTLIDYRIEIVIMTVASLAAAAYLLTRAGAEVELAAARRSGPQHFPALAALAASRLTSYDSVPLRKNRDFVLLQLGQLLSTTGSAATAIAYPLLVLALTHSPAQAGVVGFANIVAVCALRPLRRCRRRPRGTASA